MQRLLLPSQKNSFRPWLLHLRGLLALNFILLVVFFQFPKLISFFNRSAVLGIQDERLSTDRIISLINQVRVENNLPPLQVNRRLRLAAELKAKDMLTKNYWSHISPTGVKPWFFLTQAGYDYRLAGENLARGFRLDTDLVQAWLRSPLHRQNLLNPKYKQVGLAVVYGKLQGQETSLVVAFFATPLGRGEAKLVKDVLAAPISSSNAREINSTPGFLDVVRAKEVFSFLIVGLLFLAALADYLYEEKKLPKRYHGYSRLHLIFFGFLIIIIFFLSREQGLIK